MGHTISHGVRPTKERVDNTLSAKSPSNKMELKSFRALDDLYNEKFLPSIISMLHPPSVLYNTGSSSNVMVDAYFECILIQDQTRECLHATSTETNIQEMDLSMLLVLTEDIARVTKRDSTLAVAL